MWKDLVKIMIIMIMDFNR